MNKKFKSLKNRILLLIFTIILFTIITVGLSIFYHYYSNNLKILVLTLKNIEKEIIQLENSKQDLMLNFNKVSVFFISDNTRFENNFRTSLNNIQTKVDSLSGLNIIQNNIKANEQIKSFQEDLRNYTENFNELVLAYKEKGFNSKGLTGDWQDLSTQLIDKLSFFKEEPVYANIIRLKNIEKDYLLSRDPKLINELSYLSNDIQSTLLLAEDKDSVLIHDISNGFDKYLEIAKQLSGIDERVGISSKTGLISNLNNIHIKLKDSISGLSLILEESIDSKQTWLFLILLSIIIILLTGFIFILQKMFRISIFQPLTKISKYLSLLKSGKLPDDKIELNINNEFYPLSESINVLANNCKVKMKYAHDLNEGLLDTKIDILSEDDLLGKELIQLHENIQKSVEEQKKYNEDNTRRRYINEGLARFAEILRINSNNIEKLSDIFIKEIVKYLNALQGGLFLVKNQDEENKTLELKSAFAYDRKKYIDKEILMGEGLIGTCAIEKKTIIMTEIPEEYISITSGLGDTPPGNIILLPVIQEDTVFGVIEIASLNQFQKHEIEFGEQVAASLASTVTTASNNEKTSQLLAKSQVQAQEMLEQEEEMRQNMEELKATQEESVRREEEYKGIIGAVKESVFTVEYDLEGKITDINEKLLTFLGKTKKELIGKKHTALSSQDSKKDIKASFWDDLKKGKQKKIIEKIKIGKNREYILMHNFSPVLNNNKVPVKFLNIIVEITAEEDKSTTV
ncbi:MAG: GAF domain-containing protein [Bacteroidales bacterium]|nr:MAG: GAF domain-containing protein [Bacteroidales bacterium]